MWNQSAIPACGEGRHSRIRSRGRKAACLVAGLFAGAATAAGARAAQESDAPPPLEWGMILEQNTPLNWVILLVAIFLGLAVGKFLSVVCAKTPERLRQGRLRVLGEALKHAVRPVQLLVFGLFFRAGLAQIIMGEGLAAFAAAVVQLLVYVSVFWFAFNAVELINLRLKRNAEKTDSKLDDMLVPMVRKTLRIFVLVVAVLIIADEVFEQNIGAWLAGLGIVGLAVSLAAQDSLRNLFGSITILFDKPFKIGDRVAYAGYDGPIEEIGFRSSKIRTLTGHLVTVPNSRIVNDPVENIGARPYIRRIINVTITYDTPAEKVRQAVSILEGILTEPGIGEHIHGSVGKDEYPPRIYFNDFNSASLNIVVFYWYMPALYWDFLEHAQTINLRLFEEYNKAGIEFAFPTQTVYLAGDPNRELAVRTGGAAEQPPAAES